MIRRIPDARSVLPPTEWPMVGAAFVYIIAYTVSVLRPEPGVRAATELIMVAVWVVFAIDYLVRLVAAKRKLRWFLTHPLELAIVALPMLRPLRLLRVVIVVQKLHASVGRTLHGRVGLYAATSAALLIYMASLAVLDAERAAEGTQITNFGDAVWWSIVTVTTVGYGDIVLVTTVGRIIAVLLMFGGISIIGVITGLIASAIVNRVSENDETEKAATRAQVTAVDERIGQLEERISELTAALAEQGRGPDGR
ncbi:two pore domain potassium channel family protein [Hoyosella sp. G463]|uniref:Two pore domain potassium channel family protein n=1 Tax=Lolliginicoccus lacisalsi TaxID=2742202 RepID=A0A927JCI4_9ACTN|nr:potassium channel family protein [Lolliginicoccus lacisalsi]MBD8506325.1 two pore domain potassium channel family protein [Lolliginicoccus lacisalsi]